MGSQYRGQYAFVIYATVRSVTERMVIDVREEAEVTAEQWDAMPLGEQQVILDDLYKSFIGNVCDSGIHAVEGGQA